MWKVSFNSFISSSTSVNLIWSQNNFRPQYKGNGYCNDENNFAACEYDGGDCCGDEVKTKWCNDCLCVDPEYNAGCEIDVYGQNPIIPPMFFHANDTFINLYQQDEGTLKVDFDAKLKIECPRNGFKLSALSSKNSWDARYVDDY